MKIRNLTIISITIIIIGLIIFSYSFYKIMINHNEKLIYAMESKIKYYANRCILEEKCSNELFLSDLYNNNYITTVVNPVTKEILPESTKIVYENNEFTIFYAE